MMQIKLKKKNLDKI